MPVERSHVVDASRYFESWLAFRRHADRLPGVQAAILHDDEIVLSVAHGVAAVGTQEPLTERHLFRIASHSKTFTATAAMQLVERGELRLDDTVGQHVDELASAPIGAVTVRELLAHAGGVVRDGWDGDFWQLFRPFPDRDELIRVAGDAADVIPRNERFKYSNVGYSVVGLIIEQVSGLPYRDVVREHIIERLGLTDTGPDLDPARAHEYATGHTGLGYADERREIDHVDTGAMSSATGFYSTASDVVRYAAAHFHGDDRLLSDDAKRQLHHDIWKVAKTESSYGLGFEVVDVGVRQVRGHGGGFPGHITKTYFDPVDRLAVSVLTNAIDGPAQAMATVGVKLIDLAAGDHDGAEREQADLSPFCGRFATLWGVFDVAALGGRLYQLSPSLVDPTLATTRLEVVDDDTLRIASTPGFGAHGERFVYERAADGSVVSVRGASGSTAYPIDDFRAAFAGRERVTLGGPIRP